MSEVRQSADWGYCAGSYEVIVVGAGHAGCEAALAAAKLGCQVLLFTLTLDSLANMPCNPNIGGTAKGQLVRELDALGGVMGRLADRNMLQFRMLNASKGPAVMSSRAQQDRCAYQRDMKSLLEQCPNLSLKQEEVQELLWSCAETTETTGGKTIRGVRTKVGTTYAAQAVILAPGTFLESKVIIGEAIYDSGPDGLAPAHGLSASLLALGLKLKRFKTGTPARYHGRSLDYSKLELQPGDAEPWPFSFAHEAQADWRAKANLPCYLTWTTPATAELFRQNIQRSPLYSGLIKGVGPRYCPSIEDKFVKFPEHDRHHVFLEPTGLDTAEIYASGLSSSMPEDVQRALLTTIPGLEQAEIMRLAYAIEYDLIDPTQLKLSLECQDVAGLFACGQINGSSGYEEAAVQGLLAGINAARLLQGQEPLVLARSEAYIGVLIDDLVSKGTDEPYRMMTARAEYRLMLRQDNADQRLSPLGAAIGLLSPAALAAFSHKQERIKAEKERLAKQRIHFTPEVKAYLTERQSAVRSGGITLAELLRRPEISYSDLAALDPEFPGLAGSIPGPSPLSRAEAFSVETEVKYEGYLKVEQERIARFLKLEKKRIPSAIDYDNIPGLRLEARQKLKKARCSTLGQASRISGVSPADIAVLLVALKEKTAQREGGEQDD